MSIMTDSASGQAPLLSIALRGGDSLDLFADYLRGRDELLPLIELIWVGPVPDPTAPLSVATLTPPALGLRLRDGRQRIYIAADPPDTSRMIEAILGQRPDLRFPFPPPPGYGPPAWGPPPPPSGYAAAPAWSPAAPPLPSQGESAPPSYPPGYAPPLPGYAPPPPGFAPPPPPPPPGAGYTLPYAAGYAPSGQSNETLLAGLSHLSVFFAPVILPLIVWLATRNSSPYASQQAKQALVFHLVFTGLGLVVGIGGYAVFFSSLVISNPSDTGSVPAFPFAAIFLLWGGLGLFSLVEIILSIIGAVHAFQGKPFHYPLLGNL